MFGLRTPRPRMNLNPDVLPQDVAQYFADPAQGRAAYEDLRSLLADELVNVYLPAGWIAAGHRRFNVWLSSRLVRGGQRITLDEWCQRWQDGTLPTVRTGGDAL